jgi:hypothetical protein
MLTVAVSRKDATGSFEFERQALFRFPERSPDWVMQDGQKKRIQGGVDAGIELKFHDNTKPQIWVVEDKGAGGESMLSVYSREKGKVTRAPMQGEMAAIALSGLPQLKMLVHTGGAPMIIPAEQRRLGQTAMDAMQLSIIEVEVSGKAANGEWKRTGVYVPFSPFASVGKRPDGEEPAVVDVPGVGKVGLLMATTKRAMPSEVTLKKFEPIRYPGSSGMSNLYQDYLSTIEVKHKGTGETRTLVSQLNGPAVDQGLYYFQSGWDGEFNAPPEKRYTVLGVANRPGIHVMTAGALLMVLGIGYAFYVKPILLKAKKAQVAAWAGGNTKHETQNTKRGADGE